MTPVGIDDLARFIHGHGINGEITTLKVLLEGDRGVSVHHKTVIARAAFALGARQCVFLFCLRVNEYGEIAANLCKALLDHLLRRAANDHPVAFIMGVSQQSIADGAANFIDSHREGLIAGACDSCDMVVLVHTGEG